MTPTRLPAEIRGDVPGLLVRGVPVACRDGSCPGVVSAVADESCCYIAETPPDHFTRRHDGYTKRSRFIDWSSPLALYAALHWLAERGHVCLWMLPMTHGGRVEAWEGMSAWEVAAVLVSHEVRLWVAGRPGIRAIVHAYRAPPNTRMYMATTSRASVYWTATEADRDYFIAPTRLGPDEKVTPDHPGWLYTPPIGLTSWGMEVGAEAVAKINDCALTDGCALLVPSGIVVPE